VRRDVVTRTAAVFHAAVMFSFDELDARNGCQNFGKLCQKGYCAVTPPWPTTLVRQKQFVAWLSRGSRQGENRIAWRYPKKIRLRGDNSTKENVADENSGGMR
jgi:hypothetical protein